MKKRSVTRWKGAEAVARARARAEEGEGHERRHFRALLTSGPPAADATGPINPTLRFPGPRFDLFYVMPATPESISRGTLLFCVCMRPIHPKKVPNLFATVQEEPIDEKNRFRGTETRS